MKTLLIVTFLLLTQSLSSDELTWVDEQIDAIKPPRVGVKNSVISRLKDPFIFLKKKSSKKSSVAQNKRVVPNGMLRASNKTKAVVVKKVLTLDAIMNKTALISGKWYKLNDKVGKYVLSSVSRTSVILTNKNKKLVLSTNSKNLTLKFKNK